jgi:hypothetical protein
MEVTMDECVSGEEVLGLPRRFESLHLPFPTSWPTAARAFGKARTEFLAPAPNGLIGDIDATLGQQEFNIS